MKISYLLILFLIFSIINEFKILDFFNSIFSVKNYTYKNSIEKKVNFLLIFCLTVFLSKNILRIINTDNNYNNYPWPKYYAMDDKNISHGVIKKKLNGKIFYEPIQYCMYSNSPCGNYGLKDSLDLIKKKSYFIIYLKN